MISWFDRGGAGAPHTSSLLALGAGAALLTAVLWNALTMAAPGGSVASSIPPSRSSATGWRSIDNPPRLFALADASLGGEPAAYEARREGNRRDDTLTFNHLGEADRPFWRLTVARQPGDETPPPFYVDLARTLASGGLALIRSGPAALVATRFGRLEVAPVGVAPAALCTGFRLQERGPVRLSGVACRAGGGPVSSETLACTIDQLELLPAARDDAVAAFFAKALLGEGTACPPHPVAPMASQDPERGSSRTKRRRAG